MDEREKLRLSTCSEGDLINAEVFGPGGMGSGGRACETMERRIRVGESVYFLLVLVVDSSQERK